MKPQHFWWILNLRKLSLTYKKNNKASPYLGEKLSTVPMLLLLLFLLFLLLISLVSEWRPGRREANSGLSASQITVLILE